jgi:peptidoglycan hydrolase CwlO-like protein
MKTKSKAKKGSTMHTIQFGDKFLRVNYYSNPNKVWSLTISNQPKIYESRQAADKDFQRMQTYLEESIISANNAIISAESAIHRCEREIERLNKKIAGLADLPYKDVHNNIRLAESKIKFYQNELATHKPTIRSYRSDLNRYTKLKASGAVVVNLQQKAA